MKRYGAKNIATGLAIRVTDSDSIYGKAHKVLNTLKGDVIGYITNDAFYKLIKEGKAIKIFGDYWYSEYLVIA